MMLEVLEHLDQPEVTLDLLAELSTGHVIVSVAHEPFFRVRNLIQFKNVKHLCSDPEHVNHWTKRSFERLVGRRFEIVDRGRAFPWTLLLLEASPSTGVQRRWNFHTAQPAKYVPLGIANAAAVGLIAAPALGWSTAVSVLGVILLLAVAPPMVVRELRVAGRVVGADLSASLQASRSIVTCAALAAIAVGLSVATPLPGGGPAAPQSGGLRRS